jgi:hypothetical protein
LKERHELSEVAAVWFEVFESATENAELLLQLELFMPKMDAAPGIL